MADVTVRATAPLRISFVGGGTDFPHYYERHGGAVLSATIDRCAHVDISPRDDPLVTIRSLDLGHQVEYGLDEGPAYDGMMDLPKAAIDRIGVEAGMDVDIASDAPPGSGLGGSSALVTACVGALAALTSRQMSAFQVARLAYGIEREDLQIAGGWQDQFATSFGGCNLIEFSAEETVVTRLDLPGESLDELRAHLLLCYSGKVRTNIGLIDTQVRMYAEGREETIVGMKQLHEMAFEMRGILESGAFRDVGPLLREAYESKKRMNPRVAEGTAIERLLEAAQDAGASGGKICGAGGGGYVLVACEPSRREVVGGALRALGGRLADFEFRTEGVEARLGDRVWTPS